MQVKVIGLGGIGSHLLIPLCRYLNVREPESTITLLDGDTFELKNAERQNFDVLGNKAVVSAESAQQQFPKLTIEAKSWYVTDENIFLAIDEGDIIFLCVDNHATRKLVSDYCVQMKEISLISGGNEYSDGNIQIQTKGRAFKTPPITYLHDEIAHPADKNPGEMSCEELAQTSAPQLVFTNLMIAAQMLAAFWNLHNGTLRYSEQYADLTTGMTRAILRTGKEKGVTV